MESSFGRSPTNHWWHSREQDPAKSPTLCSRKHPEPIATTAANKARDAGLVACGAQWQDSPSFLALRSSLFVGTCFSGIALCFNQPYVTAQKIKLNAPLFIRYELSYNGSAAMSFRELNAFHFLNYINRSIEIVTTSMCAIRKEYYVSSTLTSKNPDTVTVLCENLPGSDRRE